MVAVRKKNVDGQEYYYLEHSYRKEGKVAKKEEYLGKSLPKNVDVLKKKFFYELYAEKWFKAFEKIRKNYSNELGRMPEYVREKQVKAFSIRFTYNSNKIEGSKLTLRETANLIQEGTTPKDKLVEDVKEAESHYKTFLEILEFKKDLSLQTVLEWHEKVFAATKHEIAGKLRQHQVLISGSKFAPPTPVEVYPLIREFFKWYDKNKKTMHAVELAALVHLKFVSIHPFADGNGRTSRLMMNFVLNKRRYPLLDIKYENHASYYNALERAQTKNNDAIFLNWFFKKYVQENEKYV